MSTPRVICVIQARLKSTRLPRKVLADLHGRPLIEHVIQRAQAIQGVDLVVLNVPETDSEIWKADHDCPIYAIMGQEQDVLGSYRDIANAEKADVIIRITGDCPLLAPDLISRALTAYMSHERGRPYNYLPLCMPYVPVADGWDAEIFSMKLLRKAAKHAGPDQREHVTTWMRDFDNSNLFRIGQDAADYTALKCSVDTADDLERVRKIMAHLEHADDFSHEATWDAWLRARKP